MKMFKGRACGKFILVGDHFVAHGSPAIAFPIQALNSEVQLQYISQNSNLMKTQMQALIQGIAAPMTVNSKMTSTFKTTLSALGMKDNFERWTILSKTDFPTSRGFGSSAAFSAALLRAMIEYRKSLGQSLPNETQASEILQTMEKTFHSNPSGVDATVVWTEKPLLFQKNSEPIFIHNSLVDFILVDSGERKGTSELVKLVSGMKDSNPSLWERYSLRVKVMAHEAEENLRFSGRESLKILSEIVSEAHVILRELSLSNPVIEEMISCAKSLGALSGKVSGAGTGGAIVLLAPKGDGKQISRKMIENKIPVLALVEAH